MYSGAPRLVVWEVDWVSPDRIELLQALDVGAARQCCRAAESACPTGQKMWRARGLKGMY